MSADEQLLAVALAAFGDDEDLPPLKILEWWAKLPAIRMPLQKFSALLEYSTSNPTGAYPGKIWRADVLKTRRIFQLQTYWECSLWVVRGYQAVPGRTDIVKNVQWRYAGEREGTT